MNDHADHLLLEALENERRYTAKELHDGVAQTTLQLGLQVGICRKLLERNNLESLTEELASLEERIGLTSMQVRALIQDLRPPAFEQDALDLNDYIQSAVEVHHQREGVPVSYQYKVSTDAPILSDAQMLGLMRIVQEALLNVRKHSQADGVRLTVSIEEDNLYLTIADDGRGFDPSEVATRAVDKGGVGLTNLRMRTKAVGGNLTVARDSIGSGTKITVILPL
jgi:two-component system sensor histidine kinase DegS